MLCILLVAWFCLPLLVWAAELPSGDCGAPRPATDLSSCDFTRADLANADVSNADFDTARHRPESVQAAIIESFVVRERR